ncbi:MAG: polyprenyl synthetase family protein [Planctomycetota bacterium]
MELRDLYRPIAPEMEATIAALDREYQTDSAHLAPLFQHLRGYRGKLLRPALVLLSGKACEGLGDEHVSVAVIVEMIHTATLVHDDVLDEATLRRGIPSINRFRGNEAAVLLGDHIYARAFSISTALSSQIASQLLSRTTQIICEGEIAQVFNRGNFELSEDEYFRIIAQKTGALYRASCELGARYAEASERHTEILASYGANLGAAFQVIDDLLDLSGEEATVGKSLGTDLEKRKMTLPLIRLRDRLEGAERNALEELWHSPGGLEEKRGALEELGLAATIEESYGRADELIRSCLVGLDELPDNDARNLLSSIAEFVLCRRK